MDLLMQEGNKILFWPRWFFYGGGDISGLGYIHGAGMGQRTFKGVVVCGQIGGFVSKFPRMFKENGLLELNQIGGASDGGDVAPRELLFAKTLLSEIGATARKTAQAFEGALKDLYHVVM